MRTRRVDLAHGAFTYLRIFEGEDPHAPVLVVWPGYGTPAAALDKFANIVLGKGVQVVTVDLRGQGASRPRPNKKIRNGFETHINFDGPDILAEVRANFPQAPIFLLGHSLGGQLATLYAARHGEDLAGLVVLASGIPHMRNFRDLASGLFVTLGIVGMNILARVLGYYPAVLAPLDGGYGLQSRGMLLDSGRIIITGRLRPTGADFSYEKAIRAFAKPVLGVSLRGDPFVHSGVVKALLARFASADVAYERNPQKLGHAGWIARPDSTIDIVVPWIAAHSGSKASAEA
jgi:predicted alpha/beta hydrolase